MTDLNHNRMLDDLHRAEAKMVSLERKIQAVKLLMELNKKDMARKLLDEINGLCRDIAAGKES